MWLAIAITVVASTACSVGKALQKEATRHLPALSLNFKIMQQYLNSRTWLAGLGADLSGGLLQIASFAMAPVSVVQPVSGVGLVGLAVYSHMFLRERMAAWEWVAVALAGLGTLGLGASSSSAGSPPPQGPPGAGVAAADAAVAAGQAAARDAAKAAASAAAAGTGGAGQQLAQAAVQVAAAAAVPSKMRMLVVMGVMLLGVLGLGVVRRRQQHRGRRRAGGDKTAPALYGLQAGGCFGLSAASCRIGFLLGRLWVLVGLAGSVGLSSSGFLLQTRGLKDGSTVVVCTCAAVSSMVMGVAVGLVGLGEPLPHGRAATVVRLASWACILAGVTALSSGAGGLRELAGLLLGRLPPGVWRALPLRLAVRLKSWTSHRVELPELSTAPLLPPLPRLSQSPTMQSHARPSVVLSLLLALVPLALTAKPAAGGARRLLAAARPTRGLAAATDGAELVPNKGDINGSHTFYWRSPENVGTQPEPLGTLVLLHRCGGNGGDFWPRSDGCPECRGLPEELAMTKQALARGYAFISVDSKDRSSGPGSNIKEDGGPVATAIKRVTEKEVPQQTGLPIYAMGASAGGSLAMQLARVMDIDGAVPMVIGKGNQDWGADKLKCVGNTPVLFIHMPRDTGMAQKVEENMGTLSRLRVNNAQIQVEPRPISETYFATRSPLISERLSAALHAALAERGLLDGEGMLTQDPGAANSTLFADFYGWLEAQLPALLEEAREEQLALPSCVSLSGNASAGGGGEGGNATATCLDPGLLRVHVRQGLEVAYADHEAVGDWTDAALAWLETGGQADIGELAARLRVDNIAAMTGSRLPPCAGGLPTCCPASGSVGTCGAAGFYACAAVGIAPAAFLACPEGLVWDAARSTCAQPGERACQA
eukprot:scaffold10.g2410.t1